MVLMRKKKLPQKSTTYVGVQVRRLAIADLQPAPYNARVITDAALHGLSRSLEQFGVVALPVVNMRPEGPRLIGGHQRIEALKRAGATDVDCVVVKFDDETERRANFALNNTAIEGEFVPELTRELINRLSDALGALAPKLIEGLRFDVMLKEIMRQVTATEGVDDVVSEGKTIDDEDLGLGKTTADSKAGAFYQLGAHRLLCAKLIKVGSLEGFGVESADMAFSRVYAAADFAEGFLDVHLGHLLKNTSGGIYLATSFPRIAQVQRAFARLGGHWSNTLVCYEANAKGRAGDPFRDVALPILYGWRAEGMRLFFGDRTQSNAWHLKKTPPKDDVPVEAIVRHVLNSSKKGGVVLDVIVGRGSTVIAAQKTGRRAIGYVSNPREMDRVRMRWARFVHGANANWKALTPRVT